MLPALPSAEPGSGAEAAVASVSGTASAASGAVCSVLLPRGAVGSSCSVVCSAPRAPQFSFDERVHQLVRAGARRGQPLPDWLILCLTDWLIHGFGFAGQRRM